ncbi:MAG TPA: GDSL-type esterase/lipase family protein [Phycisphaerae bacterium]
MNPAGKPNTAIIPAPQTANMDRNFNQKHAANVARAKQGNIDLLFVGDSIMQGWTSGGDWGKTTYDQYYTSLYNVADFAIGYNRTQHVLWQNANGEGEGFQPKVIELLIGTNNIGQNTDAEIIAGERAVLDDLRKRWPQAKILALAVFPRGTPTDKARTSIAAINMALSKMADDKNIFYLDINKIFLNDDGTTNDALKTDRLHPSAKGYAAWAQAVKPTLDKLLKDAGVTPKATAASEPATQPNP